MKRPSVARVYIRITQKIQFCAQKLQTFNYYYFSHEDIASNYIEIQIHIWEKGFDFDKKQGMICKISPMGCIDYKYLCSHSKDIHVFRVAAFITLFPSSFLSLCDQIVFDKFRKAKLHLFRQELPMTFVGQRLLVKQLIMFHVWLV